ncbi:MAG: PAS domain-containing protein [Pseudomonadota bacterium]
MADDEALREALIELEQLRAREAAARRASDAVLHGLTAITEAGKPTAALRALLGSIRESLACAETVLLVRETTAHPTPNTVATPTPATAPPASAEPATVVRYATEPDVEGLPFPDHPVAAGRPGRLVDTEAVGWWDNAPEILRRHRAVLWVPIALPEGGAGAILCLDYGVARFSPADQALLARLAGLAAQALATLALSERNALLAGVIEGTTASVAIADARDPATPLIYVNPAFTALSGYAGEAVLGRNCRFLSDEAPDAPERTRLRECVAERGSGEFVLRNRRRDGATFWNRLSLYPILDDEGLPSVLVATQVDITTERAAEAARVQAEYALAQRAAAIDAAQDGIAITDPAGRFVYMNPAHLALFGFEDEAQVLGQPWQILYEPEQAEIVERIGMAELARTGTWRTEILARARDGTPVEQEASLTLLEGIGLICVTRDISARNRDERERARLRERLSAAQRQEAMAQLSAGIAHDFNNLLSVITTSAALMDAAEADAAALARIQAAAARASALVGRMLDLGGRKRERRSLDLRQAVSEAGELLRAGIPGRIALSIETGPAAAAAVSVEADPTDVAQVLLNLGINARDALGQRTGEIRIALDTAPAMLPQNPALGRIVAGVDYACLSVSDTGSGIDAEAQTRIFRPYFTTKGVAGTGLGLAVVAGIVEEIGGALTLESSPGAGSRFTVYWPLTSTPPCPALPYLAPLGAVEPDPPNTGREVFDLQGRLVLICDDQAEVGEGLAAILERAGAETAVCTAPEDALAAITEDPDAWSLLVTDYDMPGMTGAALTEAVRAVRPGLGVVLCTALPKAVRRPALFDALCAKPVTPDTLLGAVARAAEAAAKESPCES